MAARRKGNLLERITALDARACNAALSQSERDEAEVELFGVWRNHGNDGEEWTPAAYRRLGSSFRRNDPLLAYEVFTAGLEQEPNSQALLYQQGLTLVRLGAHGRALDVATKLASEKIEDPELFTDVLSLIARVNKDLALEAASPKKRKRYLELALGGYQDAYDRSLAGYKSYPAINAATLALLLGKSDLSKRLAKEARTHARAEAKNSGSNSYWQMATIAEASLLLGEMKQAEDSYREAVQMAGRRFDDIGSMRRNARTLAKHFGKSAGWVEDVLRIPAVVVFTGHMIDRPGREQPRFPARLEKEVAGRIEKELAALNAGFGFSGAACGGDILFLEAMLKRGHINIVLPFAVDEFIKTSVAVTNDERWIGRFNRVLERAEDVHVSSGAPSDWGGIVFEYAGLLLLGLAQLRARALDTNLVGLAVWDHNPGDGPGGTAETVKLWKQRGIKVVEIHTQPLLGRTNDG
jgi:tetratricopeptide (TPR) repeat protein